MQLIIKCEMIMKQVIIFLFGFLLLQLQAFATEKLYFLMDETAGKSYSEIISEYHGYEIHTFNIYLNKDKSLLALFSILPSQKTIWKQVNIDTLKVSVLESSDLESVISEGFKVLFNVKKTMNTKYSWADGYWGIKMANAHVIIKRDNAYYTNESDGYLEFFEIISSPMKVSFYPNTLFPTRNYTFMLDISNKRNICRIADFENTCRQMYGVYSENHPKDRGLPNLQYKPFLMRDTDTTFIDKPSQRFWTYGGWTIDGVDWERGIDRLTYIPDIGIVAGAYTFHFEAPFHYRIPAMRYTRYEQKNWQKWIEYDYLHDIQSTPLRIEVNGKLVYEK